MANRLKMAEHQAILGLARLKWSYRRIAAELGVDRETVSRHVRAAAAAVPPATTATGAGPPTDANATIPITGSTGVASGDDGLNAAIVITGSTAESAVEAGTVGEGLTAPP